MKYHEKIDIVVDNLRDAQIEWIKAKRGIADAKNKYETMVMEQYKTGKIGKDADGRFKAEDINETCCKERMDVWLAETNEVEANQKLIKQQCEMEKLKLHIRVMEKGEIDDRS